MSQQMAQHVEDLLQRLEANSRSELNLVRALADAIRMVDDQTLRELRNLSLQHELRRETILGELQVLASRMCQLPTRPLAAIKAATHDPRPHEKASAPEPLQTEHMPATPHRQTVVNGTAAATAAGPAMGADWRQAAQNIEAELDYAFGPSPRH